MRDGQTRFGRRAWGSSRRAALVTLPVLLLVSATPASPGIDRVDAPVRCGDTPRLDAGSTLDLTLHGDGTDGVDRVRCTTPGCGITGTVTRRGGDGPGGGPFAELRLRAPVGEPPGEKTLEIRTPPDPRAGTFVVLVPAPLITRIAASPPSDGFTVATLDVEGHDLPRTLSLSDGSLAVLALTASNGGSRLRGGASGGRIETAQWRRSTSRRGRLTVRFADPMRVALLEVRMRPPGSCYTPGSNIARARLEAAVL